MSIEIHEFVNFEGKTEWIVWALSDTRPGKRVSELFRTTSRAVLLDMLDGLFTK